MQAPEIMQGHPYDAKVDLWSVGVIMYGMLVCTYVYTCIHPDLQSTCSNRECMQNHKAKHKQYMCTVDQRKIVEYLYQSRWTGWH